MPFVRSAGVCCAAIAGVSLTSCGATASPVSPAESSTAPVAQLVVLGDSLAVSPSRTENFPAELQKRLTAESLRWSVVNAGVSGDVTAGGRQRVESVISGSTRILVLSLGANDGLRGVPATAIEENLAAIIERARARNVSVLLCGMETPPGHGWDYTIAFHRIFPRLAARYGIPLVPFLLTGVALNPDMNGPDGLHPNSRGARQIADNVWPYLRELIERVGAGSSRAGV